MRGWLVLRAVGACLMAGAVVSECFMQAQMMANRPSKSQRGGKMPGSSGVGRLGRSRERELSHRNPNKVMVSNIEWSVTQEELQEFCSAAGTVVDIKIVKDQWTKKSKGYGFVEYSLPLEATIAIEDLTGKELKGRKVEVKTAFRQEDVRAQEAREQRMREKVEAKAKEDQEGEESSG